jgi:diaminohydroxyphosphoribosylaminopyrimidine deaminase/5-amino-6-(5-phosphoribosylamino)uracil reductase
VKIHEKYIRRCIEIGQKALGTAAPNPMVGSVITYQNKIIGEGYTSPYGGSHAEVNAINSVADKNILFKAHLYVTLEPCSHHGKTPPCADLIIKHRIKKVFIGIRDPHAKVAGAGIKKLREAGCEVVVGILEKECRNHHKRFLCYQEKKRPYIILKWAQSKDLFLAPSQEWRQNSPMPYWISNPLSRQRVHQWRSEEQSILAGTNTVILDNPHLNVRDWKGSSPLRIILDRTLKIPRNYNIFDMATAPSIILTENTNQELYSKGIEYVLIDFKKDLTKQLCDFLYKRHMSSVLVEGGAHTLKRFIGDNLWDEARVFTGMSVFKNGLKAPKILNKAKTIETLGNDILEIYYND